MKEPPVVYLQELCQVVTDLTSCWLKHFSMPPVGIVKQESRIFVLYIEFEITYIP
jgi:hypothetical protein